MTYGGGYYTNICGSGAAANIHRCSGDCDPAAGVCKSESFFVAKWECNVKSTQCGENESWANNQNLDGTACGKTVSLNVFDKNCRVGRWTCDESNLKDYMVWYSGDCPAGVTPTVVLSPTTMPTIVPTIRPTVTASPSATLMPVARRTPETGGNLALAIGGMALVIMGLWMRKWGKWVWK